MERHDEGHKSHRSRPTHHIHGAERKFSSCPTFDEITSSPYFQMRLTYKLHRDLDLQIQVTNASFNFDTDTATLPILWEIDIESSEWGLLLLGTVQKCGTDIFLSSMDTWCYD